MWDEAFAYGIGYMFTPGVCSLKSEVLHVLQPVLIIPGKHRGAFYAWQKISISHSYKPRLQPIVMIKIVTSLFNSTLTNFDLKLLNLRLA